MDFTRRRNVKRSVVLLLIALVCLAGCGGKGVLTAEVSEEDLGVPLYPGAEMIEGASGTVTTASEQEKVTWSGARLITDDSFSDVVAWYKGRLSGRNGFADMSMVSKDAEIGMFTFQEGDSIKTVIINHGDGNLEGKTVIEINADSGSLFESQ